MHQRKNIVITGGSSGIGLALALEYARKGDQLFLIARNQAKLQASVQKITDQFPMTAINTYIADVSVESEIKSVVEIISGITTQIDVLICNAGVIRCGRFENHEPAESKKSFDINYWGAHQTAYEFLPLLKNTPNCSIAFVSSVAGYTGLFGYTHYAPSKFAIAGLAECLRMEFKDFGINVHVIYPPDTETPMLEYERKNTLPECHALSKGAKTISAERAARVIAGGIEKNKFEIYFNYESKFIRLLKGLSSGSYYRIVDNMVRNSKKNR